MLIASPKHTERDMEAWRLNEDMDAINAQRFRLREKASEATGEILAFAQGGPCYVGLSWGKDSVVIAHLVARSGATLPCIYVRVTGVANPDCDLVRDAFMSSHSIDYREIESAGGQLATGRLGLGFAEAAARFGNRYISGIRGQESASRGQRMSRFGVQTDRTCAPIGWWTTAEVFAYLHLHELPIHPAYAMTGGCWEREHIRVATIGGERGRGHGRAEWEQRYYPELCR